MARAFVYKIVIDGGLVDEVGLALIAEDDLPRPLPSPSGSFTFASVAVDQLGRVIAASSGDTSDFALLDGANVFTGIGNTFTCARGFVNVTLVHTTPSPPGTASFLECYNTASALVFYVSSSGLVHAEGGFEGEGAGLTYAAEYQFLHGLSASPAAAGTGNEVFGSGAGVAIAAGGQNNTVLGNSAGSTLTTGDNNTILGFQAAGNLTTGSENTIIGSQLVVSAATSSTVAVGRSHTLTGSSRAVALGIAVTVSHDDCVALGVFAVSSKNGQFVTGTLISAWTLSQDSTVQQRPVAEIQRAWATSTDATRKGRMLLGAYSTSTFQEGIRVEAGATVLLGFYGSAAVAQQASGENLTNNVTSGGTDGTVANYTDLVIYANDAAAIRNDIYQLARKLKQVNDALRLLGLLN